MMSLLIKLMFCILIVYLINKYFIEVIKVSGVSMYPTVEEDDLVVVWKYRPQLRIGRLYVAYSPDSNGTRVVIKRLRRFKIENGEKYLWLEGDNTNHSRDSRHYGYITKHNIVGKVIFIIKRK